MIRPIPHSRPWITAADRQCVDAVLSRGMIAQGECVAAFESEVASYLQVAGGVATSSGTAALVIALRALNISDGMEVVLPSYVCRSVMDAVHEVGATPVLCDIGKQWVMTAETVASHVTSRTAAIIAVHTFGIPADIESLFQFKVPVIEDACQSFGLELDTRQSGSLGTIGILSFHATKCLTTGEGGMVVANDASLIRTARSIRDGDEYGDGRYASPMTDLQAALGQSQLSRYADFVQARRSIAASFHEASGGRGVGGEQFLFRYPIEIYRDYEEVQAEFLRRDIHVRRGVDQLLHRGCDLDDKLYLNSCQTFEKTMSIPFYPGLSDNELSRVTQALADLDY